MKKLPSLILLALLSVQVLADGHEGVEAEIRAATTAFNDAYVGNDVEAYFAYYADDPLIYFSGDRQDVDAYHAQWAEMVAAGGAVVKSDQSDLRIQVMPGGEVAIASYFVDYALRGRDGNVSASKGFETEVWQKIDGEWKIVNLHYSEIPEEP